MEGRLMSDAKLAAFCLLAIAFVAASVARIWGWM